MALKNQLDGPGKCHPVGVWLASIADCVMLKKLIWALNSDVTVAE